MSQKIEAKTGGHLFLNLLNLRGVEFVFGTTGAGMADIQDAMVVVKPPKWIQGLHEFVSVAAATGYALASQKVGVALIDRVVGTQNAVGAFYGAYMNMAPIVVFASENVPGVSIPTGEPEYHYYTELSHFVRPWIKWRSKLESLETLACDLDKAFYSAQSEPPSPVFVSLRQDLMAKPLDAKIEVARRDLPPHAPRLPDDGTLRKIADEILSSSHPFILASHAGRKAEAVHALLDFAHTFGIPVIERRVFLNYPMNDQLHLGFTNSIRPEVPKECDLLLTLEVGVLPPQTFEQQVIDLSTDSLHVQDVYEGGDYGSTLYGAKIRCVCDVSPTLKKLAKIGKEVVKGADLSVITERSAKVEQLHRELYEEWRNKARQSYEEERLDGWSIGYVLNKFWNGETTWVNAAITLRDALLRSIELNTPGTYFGNPSGHLGLCIGMAYGVALAHREYTDVKDMGGYKLGKISPARHAVVCTTGDGDAIFGNLPSALWTCAHYGIGVVYVVLNNACWGIEWAPIERSTQHWAKNAGDFEFLDLDNPRIDFSKIGESMGVRSYRVGDVSQFERAFSQALEGARNDRPSLIEVVLPKFTGEKPSVVP